MPIFKSLVWLNLEKSRCKRESNPRSAILQVDILTTRPARQSYIYINLPHAGLKADRHQQHTHLQQRLWKAEPTSGRCLQGVLSLHLYELDHTNQRSFLHSHSQRKATVSLNQQSMLGEVGPRFPEKVLPSIWRYRFIYLNPTAIYKQWLGWILYPLKTGLICYQPIHILNSDMKADVMFGKHTRKSLTSMSLTFFVLRFCRLCTLYNVYKFTKQINVWLFYFPMSFEVDLPTIPT